MKAAKKLVLCTLVMIVLVSFCCVNTHAYVLGGTTFEDANGNDLFSISLRNDNNQNLRYTLYAELERSSGAAYGVGICFASIYGVNPLTGRVDEYQGDDVLDFYEDTNTVHETDVAYFSGYQTNSCEHSISMTKRANFTPLYGKGTAIIGRLNDNGAYAIVLQEEEYPGARARIYFTQIRKETVQYAWETGDGNIQV